MWGWWQLPASAPCAAAQGPRDCAGQTLPLPGTQPRQTLRPGLPGTQGREGLTFPDEMRSPGHVGLTVTLEKKCPCPVGNTAPTLEHYILCSTHNRCFLHFSDRDTDSERFTRWSSVTQQSWGLKDEALQDWLFLAISLRLSRPSPLFPFLFLSISTFFLLHSCTPSSSAMASNCLGCHADP